MLCGGREVWTTVAAGHAVTTTFHWWEQWTGGSSGGGSGIRDFCGGHSSIFLELASDFLEQPVDDAPKRLRPSGCAQTQRMRQHEARPVHVRLLAEALGGCQVELGIWIPSDAA